MAIEHLANYINGQWVEGENNSYLSVGNRSTGEVVAEEKIVAERYWSKGEGSVH